MFFAIESVIFKRESARNLLIRKLLLVSKSPHNVTDIFHRGNNRNNGATVDERNNEKDEYCTRIFCVCARARVIRGKVYGF